jgi:tetratricopeptide (TPR) repeat protein
VDTLPVRRQAFWEGAARVAQFWLGYVRQYQHAPQALASERDNVLAAIATCHGHDTLWLLAADLALDFHAYMMRTGQWFLWEHVLRRLLEAQGLDLLSLTVAWLQRSLAEVLIRQEQWMEAIPPVKQAIDRFRAAGAAQLLARSLDDLGQCYFNLGRWLETEAVVEEIQSIVGREGDGVVLADALILRGRIHQQQGQWTEAIRFFESAVAVAEQSRTKSATNFLGQVYLQQERLREALSCFEQALRIAQKEGDLPGQGVILHNIGTTYLKMERLDLALTCLEEGLIITRETDNRSTEAVTLMRLGRVYQALEQPEQALSYLEHALKIVQQVGDRDREAEICQAIELIQVDVNV